MWPALKLLIAVVIFPLLEGSLSSATCSKHFSKEGILISCITEKFNDTTARFIALKYNEGGTTIAPIASCNITQPNRVSCQQIILFRRFGLGYHEITAKIFALQNDFDSETIRIPITLEQPKIALVNCTYNKLEEIQGNCTCKRTDNSDINTWIFLYVNQNLKLKMEGLSVNVELQIDDLTEIKCIAKNLIGWQSSTSTVNYIFKKKGFLFDTNRPLEILFAILVSVSIAYIIANYMKKERNVDNYENSKVSYADDTLSKDKICNRDWITCKHIEDHKHFVPINSFKTDHLPSNFKDEKIVNVIRLLSLLTVKIDVTRTSQARSENYSYKTALSKQSNTSRFGTGSIQSIKVYPDDGNEHCQCKQCKKDQTITKTWGKAFVLTAMRIVYDKVEAKNTTCIWGCNTDESKTVALEGFDIIKTEESKDMCYLECVTHNVKLLNKLKDTPNVYAALCGEVYDQFKSKLEKNLTILITHPHGKSQKVFVGKTLKEEDVPTKIKTNQKVQTKIKLAPACNGCDGSPVYMLARGTGWWTPLHYSDSLVFRNIHGFVGL